MSSKTKSTISAKNLRFACLSQAYQRVLEDFNLLESVNFDFLRKEIAEKNHYKKLDYIAKYLIQVFHENTDQNFWEAYVPILEAASAEHGDCFASLAMIIEKEHVNFAVRNAFFGYIALINLIPKLYKRQFGRKIQPDEYKKASLNSINLIYKLSKFHFDVFRAFIYATSQKPHGVNPDLHILRLDRFQFAENLNLGLSKKGHQEIKKESEKLSAKAKLRIDQPTIGCPALQVYNSEGKDMIKVCFDWVIEILDRLGFYS